MSDIGFAVKKLKAGVVDNFNEANGYVGSIPIRFFQSKPLLLSGN